MNNNQIKIDNLVIYKYKDPKQINKNCSFTNEKIKVLILISIFQKKLKQNLNSNNNIINEHLYIISKNYLQNYYYKEIDSFANNKDNIYFNDLSSKYIDRIFSELNYNKLIIIDKKLSKITNIPYNEKTLFKKVRLTASKEVTIYKDYILIDQFLSNAFQKTFNIQLENKNFSFIYVKNKNILINNEQSTIFIGNSDDCEYILDIPNKKDLIEELERIQQNIDSYIYKLKFNEQDNTFICPIISFFNANVGKAYKYNSKIENYYISPQLKDNFKCCPNVGLDNIGATCYMNATLQCFCHIPKFIEFFKDSNKIKDFEKKEETLSYSFKILIDHLWPNYYNFNLSDFKDHYAPEEFKSKISKMNPLFEGIHANDAKDLVNFIIMTLHIEQNLQKGKEDETTIIKTGSKLDQTNKELVILRTLNEKGNSTLISELFYGINYNETECLKCHKIIYNSQTYFFLIFPLEEVRKYLNELKNKCLNQDNNNNLMNRQQINQINNPRFIQMNNQSFQNFYNPMNNKAMNFTPQFNNMIYPQQNNNMNFSQQYNNNFFNYQQNQMNNINNFNPLNQISNNQINQNNNSIIKEVSIYDCFDYYQKPMDMNGDNAMYCSNCNQKFNAKMTTKLQKGPEILIVILNRGKGIEFDVKIRFVEDLSLEDYIESDEEKIKSYDLIGVISHLGESNDSGHFIAYCRDPIINKWFKYNDSFVTEVKDFKKQILDDSMPYVLFYKRKDNDNMTKIN